MIAALRRLIVRIDAALCDCERCTLKAATKRGQR